MSRADAAVAVAPPDAVELRIVRYRLRRSAGEALSEWAGDALLGGDGGPGADVPPLRTNVVHWIPATGGTVVFELPKDENFGADDIAQLLDAARRRGVPCAVWFETARLGGGSMQLQESWFSRVAALMPPAVDPVVEAVEVEQTPDGVVVTVDEFEPPNRAWLLFYPALLFSFAWIFFLFLDALPRMLRENWQRAMVGTGQCFTATLDDARLAVDVVRNGRAETSITVDRSALLAVGTAFGFTAYTQSGAVELPNTWATMQQKSQQKMAPAIAAAINAAIGSA